jgi:hypothetical protein
MSMLLSHKSVICTRNVMAFLKLNITVLCTLGTLTVCTVILRFGIQNYVRDPINFYANDNTIPVPVLVMAQMAK